MKISGIRSLFFARHLGFITSMPDRDGLCQHRISNKAFDNPDPPCMYTESSSYSGSYLSFSPAPGPPCCFADSEERLFTRNINLQRILTPWENYFYQDHAFCNFVCVCVNIRYTTNLNVTKQWYTSYYVCDHLMSWNKYHQTFKKEKNVHLFDKDFL